MKTEFIWYAYAACRGAPPDLFSSPGDDDDESPYPSDLALMYCDRCPVRNECLDEALKLPIEDDWCIRGGTTSYQRRQMRRMTTRRTCLGCGSFDVSNTDHHELCVSCGLSWEVSA